uniref:Reverse transcriptase Ty1/copia-type domain-containing protein n=1 Tax=Tanacetum cinerariifolium TaxID=118510 RepID=A0A6L2PBY0_TANCI|nr:hypothetical protein [Tanacetum cinerariifolium]
MVKVSLQMAKNYLDKFDDVIKAKMTVTVTNWGNWGMKHINDAYEVEVIPFVKNLRKSLKLFEWDFTKRKNTSIGARDTGFGRGKQAKEESQGQLRPSNLTSKKGLYILFQPMFDEYFKPSPSVVSLTISTETLPTDTDGATSLISIDQDAPSPSTTPNTETILTPIQDSNVEEPNQENENSEFDNDTFTNPFAPLDISSAKSPSSRIVDTSNMHTFQRPHSYIRKWMKDHSLVTIIGNPCKPISRRVQLATNAMWCYFHAFLTKFEPKNYKEAMKESSWIEQLQKYGLENSDDVDTDSVDPSRYRSMVGFLMYLIASCPDLVFVVYMRAWYQAKPTEKHLTAVKRMQIMQVAKIQEKVLREAQVFGTKPSQLVTKKQKCTAISTTEEEYISLSSCCA